MNETTDDAYVTMADATTNSFALRQRGIGRVQSFAIILKHPTDEVSAQSSIPLYVNFDVGNIRSPCPRIYDNGSYSDEF